MSQTQPKKLTEAQSKTQTKIPPTRAAKFRETLKALETRVAKLAETRPEAALEILPLFDQIMQDINDLQELGMNLSSEMGQYETILAQFKKKRALFIRRIGGSEVLEDARVKHQPSEEHWWWYVDQSLSLENRQRTIRWLRTVGIAALALLILTLLYQKFLAPDPAVRASYGHSQRAENALISGDFETALLEVQNAVALTPDQPELYVIQGVIQQNLDQSEEAQQSFDTARQKYGANDLFYNERAMLYLMMGDIQLAMEDAQAALETNPESAFSYLYLAQAYELQGNIPKAIENYEKADEIAQKTGNAQLQAIIRVSLSNAYQTISFPTPEAAEETGTQP